jgi:hypothetical protein
MTDDVRDEIIDRLYRGQIADCARWDWVRSGGGRMSREPMSSDVRGYFQNYLGID